MYLVIEMEELGLVIYLVIKFWVNVNVCIFVGNIFLYLVVGLGYLIFICFFLKVGVDIYVENEEFLCLLFLFFIFDSDLDFEGFEKDI